jgi:hypothetical protein
MKKSVLFLPLQLVIFLGIFFTAFAGFFYAKLNSANHTSDQISRYPDDQATTISSTEQDPSAWHNAHTEATTALAGEPQVADEHMTGSKKASKSIALKPADKISREQNTVYHPQSVNAPVMSHTAEYNYTETETIDHNTNTAAMSINGYNDYSSNSNVEDNSSSTDTTGGYNQPSVTADNFIGTTTDNAAEVISDGSEFLPDGSSQEDLVNSLSKNPRVYTIKDYQSASIDCTYSNGASSAHAELIYKLKGCK